MISGRRSPAQIRPVRLDDRPDAVPPGHLALPAPRLTVRTSRPTRSYASPTRADVCLTHPEERQDTMSTTLSTLHPARRAQGQAAADLEQWRLQQDRRDHGSGRRVPGRPGRRTAGCSGPRRGHRDRSRGPGGRPPVRASSPGSTTCPGWSRSPDAGPPRRTFDVDFVEADAEELPFDDEFVRLRPVRHRRDVHRRPRSGGGRAGARVPTRWTHRAGELDADRLRRPAAQDGGQARAAAAGRPVPDPVGNRGRRARAVRRAGRGTRLRHRDGARSGSRRRRPSPTLFLPTTGPPTRRRSGSPEDGRRALRDDMVALAATPTRLPTARSSATGST